MLKRRHFTAALMLWTVLAAAAHAQPPRPSGCGSSEAPYPHSKPGVEALQRKIVQADRAAERMGYFPINVERSSTIRPPRQTDTVAVLLGSGRYLIVGHCDTSCTAMDLEVFDRNTGQIVAQEKSRGYPMVFLELTEQRNLAVKILIKQCPSPSCRYSVKVYATRPFPLPGSPESGASGSTK